MNRSVILLAGLLAVAAVGGYFVYDRYFRSRPLVSPHVEVADTQQRTAIPVPNVHFTDVTDAAGIQFRHVSGATDKKLLPETMGSGVAVIDYDADGRPDLLFVNSCPWPGQPNTGKPPCLALYRNAGNGKFEDATEAAGLAVTMFGLGACVGDYDNDGFPDLFITGVGGNKLFHNVAGPGKTRRFADVTATAHVGGAGGWPKDLGSEAFYKSQASIPFATSATFVDYDGDAKLDLFVCHYVTWSPAADLSIASSLTGIGRSYQQPTNLEGGQCALYRNNGDGTFTNVSESAGVTVYEKEGTDANARKRSVGKSLGVIVCDPDGDGWPDLVVANDTVRNFFFHNVPGANGGRKFEEIGRETSIAFFQETGSARGAMGIDWGEYLPDKSGLVITNFANEPNSLYTLTNPKRLRFSDVAASVGLYGPSRQPLKFGAFFFDYDLDGRLDLLTANGHIEPEIDRVQPGQKYAQPPQLFWNAGQEGRVFEPVTSADAGKDLFQAIVGRGCAYLDFDGDGDLDIVLTANNGPARLLRNDNKLGHHWIRLMLVGDGKRSNRSAIGAAVTIDAGGNTYHRSVAGAKGYLSQSEFPITVGLGTTDKVDKVTVRWPSNGTPQVWTNLAVDRSHTLEAK